MENFVRINRIGRVGSHYSYYSFLWMSMTLMEKMIYDSYDRTSRRYYWTSTAYLFRLKIVTKKEEITHNDADEDVWKF